MGCLITIILIAIVLAPLAAAEGHHWVYLGPFGIGGAVLMVRLLGQAAAEADRAAAVRRAEEARLRALEAEKQRKRDEAKRKRDTDLVAWARSPVPEARRQRMLQHVRDRYERTMQELS